MDTKPIFDFLDELEFRNRYQRPSADADRSVYGKSKGAYFRVLRVMEREFEASLFQCMAEDKGFNVEAIVSRLFTCLDYLGHCNLRESPELDVKVAFAVARECIESLYRQGIIKPDSETPKAPIDGLPADVANIDWDKPVYTADEVKKLFGVSDSTFRRWINGGWIAYSQVDGSDKKYIQREHIMAFLNNPKIHYPSTK